MNMFKADSADFFRIPRAIGGYLLGLALLVFLGWTYVELSALMAQRTGVREAVWMGVAVLLLFSRSDRGIPIPGIIALPLLVFYPVNAVILLWDNPTWVFWAALVLMADHAIRLVAAVWANPFPDFARRPPEQVTRIVE